MTASDIAEGTLLIVVGVLLCLAGYALFRVVIFCVGFFLVFFLSLYVIGEYWLTQWQWIYVALVCFPFGLVGGFITCFFVMFGVSSFGALGGLLLGTWIQSLGTSGGLIEPLWLLWMFLCVLMLIGAFLAVLLVRPGVIVLASFVGSFFIMAAVEVICGFEATFAFHFAELWNGSLSFHLSASAWVTLLFYAVWAVLFVCGIVFQIFGPWKEYRHDSGLCDLSACCDEEKYEVVA